MSRVLIATLLVAASCAAGQALATPSVTVDLSVDGGPFFSDTSPTTLPFAAAIGPFDFNGSATPSLAPFLNVTLSESAPLTAGHDVKVAVTHTGLSGSDIIYFQDDSVILRNSSTLSSADVNTYFDASDTPFATTDRLAYTTCDGGLMGCTSIAFDTIDTSIPYSITEIFDVDFAAGYAAGDISYTDTWSELAVVPRPTTVPEPASIGLVGLGLVMAAVVRRRRPSGRIAMAVGQ